MTNAKELCCSQSSSQQLVIAVTKTSTLSVFATKMEVIDQCLGLLFAAFILLLSVTAENRVHQYLSDNGGFSTKIKVYFQEITIFHAIISYLASFHDKLMNKSCLTTPPPPSDLHYCIQVITMQELLLKSQNFSDFSVHKSSLSLPDVSPSLSAATIW